jgi:UDP-glucose 4-epimerase
MMQYILVTGWMGFIWSHTVVALVEAGYQPIIFDNLSNSSADVLDAIQNITGVSVPFVHGDIRNKDDLAEVFARYPIDVVMHFAALKSVGESCSKPGLYFANNVTGTINLIESMLQYNTKKIIFSGSCTVYGAGEPPVSERSPVGYTTNPYGTSKVLCEKILEDYVQFAGLQAISLRYFNPIGAHPSGLLGEQVAGIPNNIFPYILKVLSGDLPTLHIFGDDYPTVDGTWVRDYIDIIDLAQGHIAALKYINTHTIWRDAINLWTGKGTSVLELVTTTAQLAGKNIPYVIADRRPGDVAEVYAAVEKAKDILWWEAQYTIQDSVRNALRFVGYTKAPGL